MTQTDIRACDCSNKGQDTIHGKGMRVHNAFPDASQLKPSEPPKWRCTVCSKEK